jgi:hypothetical protein
VDSIPQPNPKRVLPPTVLLGGAPFWVLSTVSSPVTESTREVQPGIFIVKSVLAERWKQSDDATSISPLAAMEQLQCYTGHWPWSS